MSNEVHSTAPAYELTRGIEVDIKSWTRGVPFEDQAREQVRNISSLPFIHKWIAVMPDVHLGKGATIGSVVPTVGAVIPAAVGVDIGCGMMAVRTSLVANDLPDSLSGVRTAVEAAVPHGARGVPEGQETKVPGGMSPRTWPQLGPDCQKSSACCATNIRS